MTDHARRVLRDEAAQSAVLLTGMPLEERVEEFRSLVGHLPPEAADGIRPDEAALGGRAFRGAVAPVHLRRDQRDVLAELPDVVRVDELVALSRADQAAHQSAEGEVIVFSCFPDVLATVQKALGADVFGPLTGETPEARRQEDPDVEARAIGGASGAGRTGTVRVHRLLAPGTVDEWVGEGSG
jgi:SNF2 family DNA or RNA helicase